MNMRITELQKKILKAVKGTMSHKDLCSLCIFNELSSSGLKRSVQDRLELFIISQTYNQLVKISNKIDEFAALTVSNKKSVLVVQDAPPSTYSPDRLSDVLLSSAPINLLDEVANINRNAMVVLNFTNYSSTLTPVPTQTITGINERAHNVRLPNMLPHVPVQVSPFYCGVVCLHPLALMVPNTMPNVPQSNRITSHANFQFTLSDDSHKLITKNSRLINNKIEYRWQVLLRFVAIDSTAPLPQPGQTVTQIMPPYLTVSLNGDNVPLWEILPSNCRIKEGKRHPKAVNITEKLCHNRSNVGYKQSITISWWQTPGIFQYYYVGVYLERKLYVEEILDLFATNRHINILPIETTLNFIKSKLNDARYNNNDDDDDLVVSSILPISLACPVGRGRIEIPIRTLKCTHLQCFDAHLFLSMNERRSIWKCPVCDTSATPNELFCDKYFQKILFDFKSNDDVTDVNVSCDGSYIPVFKHSDDKKDTEFCEADDAKTTNNVDTMIVLDSDDDEEQTTKTAIQPQKSVQISYAGATRFISEPISNRQSSVHINSVPSLFPQTSGNSLLSPRSSLFNPVVAPSIPFTLQNTSSQFSVPPPLISAQRPSESTNTSDLLHAIQAPVSTQAVICAPTGGIESTLGGINSLFKSIDSTPIQAPAISIQTHTAAAHTLIPAPRIPRQILETSTPESPLSNQSKVANKVRAQIAEAVRQAPYAVPLKPQNPSTSALNATKPTSTATTPSTCSFIRESILNPVPPPSKPTQWDTIPAPPSVAFPISLGDQSSDVVDIIPAIVQNPIVPAMASPMATRAPISSPISAPLLENIFKVNSSSPKVNPTNPINTLFSSPPPACKDVVRTIKDVVMTLATDLTATQQPSVYNKVFAPPISCPAIILDHDPNNGAAPLELVNTPLLTRNTKRDEDADVALSSNADNAASERQRRTILRPAVPPQGGVNIPAVSIDLTEDDDEENDTYVRTTPAAIAAPTLPSDRTKWHNKYEASIRNSLLGQNSKRTVLRYEPNGRQMNIGNYKSHQVTVTRGGATGRVVAMHGCEIDLTGDDGDDDGDNDDIDGLMTTSKRRKISMGDSDEESDTSSDSLERCMGMVAGSATRR